MQLRLREQVAEALADRGRGFGVGFSIYKECGKGYGGAEQTNVVVHYSEERGTELGADVEVVGTAKALAKAGKGGFAYKWFKKFGDFNKESHAFTTHSLYGCEHTWDTRAAEGDEANKAGCSLVGHMDSHTEAKAMPIIMVGQEGWVASHAATSLAYLAGL